MAKIVEVFYLPRCRDFRLQDYVPEVLNLLDGHYPSDGVVWNMLCCVLLGDKEYPVVMFSASTTLGAHRLLRLDVYWTRSQALGMVQHQRGDLSRLQFCISI